MAKLKKTGRDLSLVFCGSLGAYLVSLVVTARLAMLLSDAIRHSPSVWARVALGLVALDLGKVPGLLLASWILARATHLSPWGNAVGLVLMVYAFDLVVSSMLQQFGWLWGEPAVLACRVAAAVILSLLLARLTKRWRRRKTTTD